MQKPTVIVHLPFSKATYDGEVRSVSSTIVGKDGILRHSLTDDEAGCDAIVIVFAKKEKP
jgi:hypothetical protein